MPDEALQLKILVDTNMRAWPLTILRNLHSNQCCQAARRPTNLPMDEMRGLSSAPVQGQRLALRDLSDALP